MLGYGYLRCPACGDLRAERSPTRGVGRVLKHFTSLRPYKCRACGWRAWCVVRGGGAIEPRGRLEPGGRYWPWHVRHRPVR